ncbi:MAG: dihydrolipoyl dehydrogenase [Deltaproteobacteria bacterium]|nr:dihydrolipoyl dehydrogenase [Deltaproteobacteria bacterium]
MTKENGYDVVIIGAGPGGYVTGIRAGQLGLKACVIERDTPGGVCVSQGCIPTKNLIHNAGIFHSRFELEKMGLAVDSKKFDYGYVQEQSRAAVRSLVRGVEYLLKKNKVDYVQGTAVIVSKNKVILEDQTEITGTNIVIATGSRPSQIKGFEFDEKQVLSSTGILSLKELPDSLIILGGGAIGCEFAYIMNTFGVKVHLVEMEKHILPLEDARSVAVLEKSFKDSGIDVITGAHANSLEKTSGKVTVTLTEKDGNSRKIEAEKILCVFGRTPNTNKIGLENIGLKTENGYIPVGDYYQTQVEGVYAIGDVVKTPLLAHVASKEGEIVGKYIAGHTPQPRVNLNEIPSAIYCEPQLASFGLREDQAKDQNIPYKKAIYPYRGVGKAVAIGKTEGMVKTLYDPETHEILGAHIVGHDATELIHEILLAKTAGLLPEKIAEMIHAHPTMSEVVMEQMRAVDGQPIHM